MRVILNAAMNKKSDEEASGTSALRKLALNTEVENECN